MLKVSYSCMGNMASIIPSHIHTILNPDVSLEYRCNCRWRNKCPLQNKCLTPKIVYRADLENKINDEKIFYFGGPETPFKERFRNHKKEFNYAKYRNSTELSKYIWQLKDLNMTPKISWEIAAVIRWAARTDCCKLCLTEKLFIIRSFDNNQMLNKKSELVNTCRHKNKFLFKSLKRNHIRNDTMDWVFSGKMIYIGLVLYSNMSLFLFFVFFYRNVYLMIASSMKVIVVYCMCF